MRGAEGTVHDGRGQIETVQPAAGPGRCNRFASADGSAPEHLGPDPLDEGLAGIVGISVLKRCEVLAGVRAGADTHGHTGRRLQRAFEAVGAILMSFARSPAKGCFRAVVHAHILNFTERAVRFASAGLTEVHEIRHAREDQIGAG